MWIPVRAMMIQSWLKRTYWGRAEQIVRNADETGLSESEIGTRFWPGTEQDENVPGWSVLPVRPPTISRR